jgi:hypothetical protein
MFQQNDTFCTAFYSLQTALHVSGETFTHHQELGWTVVTSSGSDTQYVDCSDSTVSDSPTTTEGHILSVTTGCCNYSLFELLMMGECFTRNMYSCLQGIKYCTKKKCHLVGTFFKNWFTMHGQMSTQKKPTRLANFSNFLGNETLHVSDSSSVHHQ